MGVYTQKCLKCRKQATGFLPKCACGGAVEIFYDLSEAAIAKATGSFDPFTLFFDILPIRGQANILASSRTPTRLIHSRELGKLVGLSNLYLKVEGDLPTGTTKDRMASVSLSFLRENSVAEFVLATTGNTGAAYAYGAKLYSFFDIHLFFYGNGVRLAADLSQRVQYYRAGDNFDLCSRAAKRFSDRSGFVWEGGFFNPARREGLKMAFVEAVAQSNISFDSYFQSVSSGMGILGTLKGAGELLDLGITDHLPKLFAIQENTCSPMVDAFLDKSKTIMPRHVASNPSGICKAILRGDPSESYPYVSKCVQDSGGAFLKVNASEIRQAMNLLLSQEGILVGEEGAAALAGAIKASKEGRVDSDESILINLSSGQLRHRSPPKKFVLCD